MSYFKDSAVTIIDKTLEFGQVNVNTLNKFVCQNGEVAGFRIRQIGNNLDGTPCYVSQVYDCTSGSPILKGSTWMVAGMDLSGGLFLSGCVPDKSPLDTKCIYYLVNYSETPVI